MQHEESGFAPQRPELLAARRVEALRFQRLIRGRSGSLWLSFDGSLGAGPCDAAAGAGFENVGEDEPETGKSECIWLLDRAPNPKAVVVTFWQKKAVPGGDLAAFFETQAKRAEAVHENKREKLPGIGAAAALVPGMKPGAMAVLIVQTAEGVAYVETDYLVRSQVTDIAKAVAAP